MGPIFLAAGGLVPAAGWKWAVGLALVFSTFDQILIAPSWPM